MATLDFNDKTLERLYRGFKWARNNSLQLLQVAQAAGKLEWRPKGEGQHTVLYQFQCLATTTDVYYRRLTGEADARFGFILQSGELVKKEVIPEENVQHLLKSQLAQLEALLKHFDSSRLENKVQEIQAIANHEYLHQGQLVVMFRQAGVRIPERFRAAFDL